MYVKRAIHATLHIVASVRAPCPTCLQPPCLVCMLNEPFMQDGNPGYKYLGEEEEILLLLPGCRSNSVHV
eukprot:3942177-Prymnesium_polylepis.1